MKPWLIDAHLPRRPEKERPWIEVAVGILYCRQKKVYLMSSRPEGKPYAGYWEFPGGKKEEAETLPQTLYRELVEELGIEITGLETLRCWKQAQADYPHARVNLHFYIIEQWTGLIEPKEGQQYSWTALPTELSPILPASIPILEALQKEPLAPLPQ